MGKTGKMAQTIPCQGKHREFGHFAKFCKDVAIFAVKFPDFLKSVLLMKLSQISEIGTRESTGNL